jgi:hypothetical protein
MDKPTGDGARETFLTIRPATHTPDWARSEFARRERDAAAVRRRTDPDSPTPEELDRERRERYAAERANPTGTLAARVAAFRRAHDPEHQRSERRRLREALGRGIPSPAPTPSAPETVVNSVARVDYHALALNGLDPDLNDIDPVLRPINRLAAATDSGLMLLTGIAVGPIRLHAEAAVTEPEVDTDEWEAIVEVPIDTPEGRIRFSALFGGDAPDVNLATSGPGTYQVRIGNRGYHLAYDLAVIEPVEDVLVQVWPTAAPRTRVVKND